MRNFFEPAAAAPAWLRQVLSSIRAALGDIWPAPLRLKDYATADLPAAADFVQGLVYNRTTLKVSYSTGAAWVPLSSYTDEDARDAIGAALVAGPAISIAVDDGADTVTIASPLAATATGAPGTGSFTPANAQKAVLAMMQLRVGGCYLFRFDDGAAWELRWGFYTGSAFTRPANGFVASATGSALTLGANAVASVLVEAGNFQRNRAECTYSVMPAFVGGTTPFSLGHTTAPTGTAAAGTFADTNVLTRHGKTQFTSATTANAVSEIKPGAIGFSRNAGFNFSARFGVTQLPTGPRLIAGLTNSITGTTVEPGTLTDAAFFGKDSTDANIQMMVNDNAGSATKRDTSIALAINNLYEANLWCDAGGATLYGLLVDYSNQALWYGSAAANLPTAGTFMMHRVTAGLNGTNTGTALVLQFAGMFARGGA